MQVLTLPINEGIYPIVKPKGHSSYDMIRSIKRFIDHKVKIGHGGTLDPLASGVLVVAIGSKFTKQLHTILHETTKVYEATICLGGYSETDDLEGPIHSMRNPMMPDIRTVNEVVASFIGTIEQIPPTYSAVKVGGIAAYKQARQGNMPELASKKVFIESIRIISYMYPHLVIQVVCGSGVYIRSLARDLGTKLMCGGYIESLTRTRVGNYTLEGSYVLADY